MVQSGQEHERQVPGRSLSLAEDLYGRADAQHSWQHTSSFPLQPERESSQEWHAMSSSQHHGLVFHVHSGNAHLDTALQALTALAQVQFCSSSSMSGFVQQAPHMLLLLCNVQ